jgi:hypothetical protein
MEKLPQQLYLELMQIVRKQFDFLESLNDIPSNNFEKSEIAAFHGRKIVEAIAFGCLISTENGLKYIPKEAKGQYNAETILKALIKKGIDVFPSPCIIRNATPEEVN